jgi:hypothetical protein
MGGSQLEGVVALCHYLLCGAQAESGKEPPKEGSEWLNLAV